MTAPIVHVVGSVNQDLRLGVDAPPRPGETVIARGALTELGGKGANQAIAARRAGARVRFVGSVGEDVTGAQLREGLAAEGIDVSALEVASGSPTGRAIVTVSGTGENQIIVVGGANAAVDAGRVRAELSAVRPGDPVVLQLELPLDVVAAAAARARERGGFVVLNAAPVDTRVLSLMDDVDVLVVNQTELTTLADASGVAGESPDEAARRLASTLDVRVLCTLGDRGSLLFAGDELLVQPAVSAEVVDTTGAGDTYIGYLAAALAERLDWPEALRHAARAASVAVTRPGAAQAIPSRSEFPHGVRSLSSHKGAS